MILDDLEQPPEWRELVEDWWISQCQDLRALVEEGLRKDFLLSTVWESPWLSRDDHHSLFAKFGITHLYYHHWKEDYEVASSLRDLSQVADPEWGGLGKWKELEADPVPDDGIPFSPTLVYKSSVLAQNLWASGVDLNTLSTVVHWGGGIGLQSMLMRWWGAKHTEYLIDLPAMSLVQYEYIGRNMGWDEVHLADTEVKEGVINVVPLSRLHLVPDDCDMFLSLHALSESSAAAQNYVVERNWFNAEKLVLEWTEGIFFEGTGNWANIVNTLGDRIAPRSQARAATFRSRWNGDTRLLAKLYEQNYGVPVLRVTPESWVNVPPPRDWMARDLDVVMEVTRESCPIIVIDVTHAANDRRRFEWIKLHVQGRRYRLEEHREALVFIDKDLFPIIEDEVVPDV